MAFEYRVLNTRYLFHISVMQACEIKSDIVIFYYFPICSEYFKGKDFRGTNFREVIFFLTFANGLIK